jgi:hypothetical protein
MESNAGYLATSSSSIIHIAPVKSIDPYKNTNKYIHYFAEPTKNLDPIELKSNSTVRASQAPLYTSFDQLEEAKTLDDAF